MKTIKQTEEISFNAISIQDAITMLPLIDRLANELFEKERRLEKAKNEYNEEKLKLEYIQLCAQIDILCKLGFRPSVEGMIQYDPNLFTPTNTER